DDDDRATNHDDRATNHDDLAADHDDHRTADHDHDRTVLFVGALRAGAASGADQMLTAAASTLASRR
ncbi:MAG: hypothetical protein WKF64_07425, partial [Ilumatobacteraceae bacterium]